MKRYFALILSIFLILSLFGCSQTDINDIIDDSFNNSTAGVLSGDPVNAEPTIIGYVMNKQNERILVVNPDAVDFSSTGGIDEYYDAVWLSNAPENINVGEKVKVWFSDVMDSYPAQSSIESIEVIPSQRPDGAALTEAEALYEALASAEINTDIFLVVISIEYDRESNKWSIKLKEPHGDDIYSIIVQDPSSAQASADNTTPGPLVLDDDLALGKLKVNMTRQMIDEVMQAELQMSEKDSSYGIESEYLFYDDETVIHLVEGKIYSISVATADYPSPRGLKVGDTEDTLKQLYGEPTAIEGSSRWIYSSEGGYDLIFVTVEDGVVAEIMVSQVM
jgi:hypothetical protein